tara:strand:+ start:326 stop:649 length:324 start_codon:yes stop_codon:yes gene_type:complete
MDSKTIGIAVGASALGAALAYLGYTNMNDDANVTSVLDITDTLSATVDNVVGFETENEVKADDEKIKNEVKNVISQQKWGQFWKSEYGKVDKTAEVKPGINAEGFSQ